MLPKHCSNTTVTTSVATMAAAAVCGNCGEEEERLFLHHVRHRGIFLRFCTSCVLRHHPHSFCPTCFAVYHPSPPTFPPKDAVTCFKCYSSSHPHCVGPNPPSPYICPLCVNPKAPISVLSVNVDGRPVINKNRRVIDKKAARIFFAASRISCMSMNKAALAARAEAERRAMEAASARKRAREALENVMLLVGKEKMKKNKAPLASSIEDLRSGGNIGGLLEERRNSSNNNDRTVVAGAVLVEKNRMGNVHRMNNSNEVLASLDVVELRDKQKLEGVNPQIEAPWPSLGNGVEIEVEEHSRVQLAPNGNGSGLGSIARNHGGGSVRRMSSSSSGPKNQSYQWVKNGVVPRLPVKDQDRMQGVANGHAGEENTNGPEQ